MKEKLLDVKNLVVKFNTDDGVVHAINDISFEINKGDTLGLVGETGAGKTTTALSIIRLIQSPPGKITQGNIIFKDKNLLEMKESDFRKIRGKEISMVFQDPMTSLNPVITVIEQVAEVIENHKKISKLASYEEAEKILELVNISKERAYSYPHQFSGGMKQRVVIAMALACNPDLLIADEPTTALDVTIQAQVLDLMSELKKEFGTSIMLITHDLGVVAEICDKVAIMYAGEIVEYGAIEDIFENTKHPYTKGLFESIPILDEDVDMLKPINGETPNPMDYPNGCKFHPRCPYAEEICKTVSPKATKFGGIHEVRCLAYEDRLTVKEIR